MWDNEATSKGGKHTVDVNTVLVGVVAFLRGIERSERNSMLRVHAIFVSKLPHKGKSELGSDASALSY